jgi:peptidyl-prolyl cis-trans isomerase D
MLESMRNAAQGVVGRAIMTVVMGLIIVSFVIWGVGDMLRGFTSDTVASVGGTKISQQEFRDSYQRTLQQYQRRLRQPFTNEQARAVGLDREVLQRLVSQAALDDTTHRLGLGVSDDAIRAMITTDPNFRNKDGQFDPQMFASVLRDNDLNEKMFVDDLRKTALRQFVVAALTAGVVAPKAEVAAEADYVGQTRSADYFILPASAAGDIQPPTEEALKSFFNERKSSYRAPEFRSVEILSLTPEDLANPAEVTDADAQAAYTKLAGRDPHYGAPEKRTLQQILFPNEGEADAAAAKLKGGASFDDLLKDRNMKPEDADIGETSKDAMTDPATGEAVFALPQGGVSGVLKTAFGPAIIRVKGITPSTVKPYAEVADAIKRQVSASRAGDKIQALHDKIEDLRVSGKSLADAAKEVGLKTITIPAVDAKGFDPKGETVTLPDSDELLRAVFASDVGLDEAPLQTRQGGFVWFGVTKIDPTHDRTFEEARPEVEKQWRASEIDKALAAKAADLVKQVTGGGSIAEAAKSVGAEAKTASGVHRDDKSLPETLVAAIFRQPADGAGSAAVPDGRAIFRVTADDTPNVDFADLRVKQMAEGLDASVRDAILEQYVDALRRTLGVAVHESAMQSAEGS